MGGRTCCCCLPIRAGAFIIAILCVIKGGLCLGLGYEFYSFDFCKIIEENSDVIKEIVDTSTIYEDCTAEWESIAKDSYISWMALCGTYTLTAVIYIIGLVTMSPCLMILLVVLESILTTLLIVIAVLLIILCVMVVGEIQSLTTFGYVTSAVLVVWVIITIYFLHILRVYIGEAKRVNKKNKTNVNASKTAPSVAVVTTPASSTYINHSFQGPPQTGYHDGAPPTQPQAMYGAGYGSPYTNSMGYNPHATPYSPMGQPPQGFTQFTGTNLATSPIQLYPQGPNGAGQQPRNFAQHK